MGTETGMGTGRGMGMGTGMGMGLDQGLGCKWGRCGRSGRSRWQQVINNPPRHEVFSCRPPTLQPHGQEKGVSGCGRERGPGPERGMQGLGQGQTGRGGR